jgi:glycyl-tRNA synthetase beta chain
VENLALAQTDKTVEKRGPALQAAFGADDTPSKAAIGFAASCQTTVDKLERLKTDKGEWLAFTQNIKGQATAKLLPDIIRRSIQALPVAKRMRWGNNATEFVRPVHWAVLLFGEETIKTDILGLETGNQTYGHRFHAPQALTITAPEQYQPLLYQEGKSKPLPRWAAWRISKRICWKKLPHSMNGRCRSQVISTRGFWRYRPKY